MGTGVLPPGHPQLLGIIGFWGSPAANRLASEADVILAVGTRFPRLTAAAGSRGHVQDPADALIHVDLDPHEPGRNYPAAIAATADAALALDAIAEAYGDPTPDRGYDWTKLGEEREAFLAPSRANAGSDTSPCCPSGSWPTCGVPSPTRSW